jgi:hypothetical protein
VPYARASVADTLLVLKLTLDWATHSTALPELADRFLDR